MLPKSWVRGVLMKGCMGLGEPVLCMPSAVLAAAGLLRCEENDGLKRLLKMAATLLPGADSGGATCSLPVL